MILAVVGSGGKTTLIRQLADRYRAEGRSVLVTTTTHMYIEADTLLTDDPKVIIRALQDGGYAMAGILAGEKIGPLSAQTYRQVCDHADVVLVEADGSKHMPLKFPADHEPVIPENVDVVMVVCGLQAVGKPAKDVCHRLELVIRCLGITEDTPITPEHIRRLLREGYVQPLGRKYPGVPVRVLGNRQGEFVPMDIGL